MTGPESNANLPPPPPPPLPCFLPGPRYAYTAQVCAERACVLSMNRPADKGNDYMAVFILKRDFYWWIISTRQACTVTFCRGVACGSALFSLLVVQWIPKRLEHTVCILVGQHALPVRTHMLTHTQQSFHLASRRTPLIYIFRRIFHRKRVLSSILAGEIESFASERAGLSRTRNLLWKPGSSRRNPGNVLTQKWVPFPWKSCAELGI